MRFLSFSFTIMLIVCSARYCVAQQMADLVLRGGHVVTVDDDNPQGQSIAISGDKILAVGSDDEIDNLTTDETRIIELNGRLAIPGFIEGHAPTDLCHRVFQTEGSLCVSHASRRGGETRSPQAR